MLCLPGMSKDAFDSPWKGILDRYFPAFIAFFFPAINQDIDWSRGYEILDKELEKITRDGEIGKRRVDKLIKVWRLSGEEQVVYIHVEVQAQRQPIFDQRMYVYNYRVYDRYREPVVSLAILADDKPEWKPDSFTYELWGCKVSLKFPVVKLWDYNETWDDLAARTNPFATVVMAHLKTQATRKDPDSRMRWKMFLFRRLYESGYDRQQILDLLWFIDWVMWLPPKLKHQFEGAIEAYEAEKKMEYMTTWERNGLEKGLEKGLAKGIRKGEATILKRQLTRRFAGLPAWVEERLAQASREQLESWADRVLDAKRLEDVFSPA